MRGSDGLSLLHRDIHVQVDSGVLLESFQRNSKKEGKNGVERERYLQELLSGLLVGEWASERTLLSNTWRSQWKVAYFLRSAAVVVRI
jgi:hypothetical protein